MTIKDLSLEEKISIAMKRKNYTYQKLADELGISSPYVFDIVKGNRKNTERLSQILKILDL